MAKREKKSIAYYVVVANLVVIGVPFLFAVVWQPSFSEGYISIPFGSGSLFFPLWKFLAVCTGFFAFFYAVQRTMKSDYRKRFFLLSLLLGFITIGLCAWLFNDFEYTESSWNQQIKTPSFIFLYLPFFAAVATVVSVLSFLIVKRNRYSKNQAIVE